jgi:hypothetical protein
MPSMATSKNERHPGLMQVIHPLDDIPEAKKDVTSLGPMPMTPSVRASLLALRAYLILMACLVLYRFISLI